jgi:hypothetical protein
LIERCPMRRRVGVGVAVRVTITMNVGCGTRARPGRGLRWLGISVVDLALLGIEE